MILKSAAVRTAPAVELPSAQPSAAGGGTAECLPTRRPRARHYGHGQYHHPSGDHGTVTASHQPRQDSDEALRRLLQQVWRDHVGPQLTGRFAAQRRAGARWGARVAGASGRFVDSLLNLRGRPFARALGVLGMQAGALIPDAWDWSWWRRSADRPARAAAARAVRQHLRQAERAAALACLGLPEDATAEQVRTRWRELAHRWHPDRAPSDEQRREHQLRFIAYRAAVDRLRTLEAGGDADGAAGGGAHR